MSKQHKDLGYHPCMWSWCLLCLLWIYPIVLILINSSQGGGHASPPPPSSSCPPPRPLPACATTSTASFKMNFLSSLGYSLLITVSSVVLDPAVLLHDAAGTSPV